MVEVFYMSKAWTRFLRRESDHAHLSPLVRGEIHLEQHRDQVPRLAGTGTGCTASVRRTGRVGDELVELDRARAVGQRVGRPL